MKKFVLTPRLLSATLFLALGTITQAQETPPPPPAGPPDPHNWREEMLKKFDQNGDGQLDADEKAAARAAMKKRHGARAGFGPSRKGPRDPQFRQGWMLGKFDQNNDGRLDKAEKEAARPEIEKRMRARLEKQIQHLKGVDTDGDGKINDAEWAAAKEQRQKMRAEHGKGHDGPPFPPEDGDDGPPPDGLGGNND